MEKRFISRYFFKRRVNQIIDQLLEHHIKRIKKSYLKRVQIRFLKSGTDIGHKNSNAYIAEIMIDGKVRKEKIITIQFENLRKITENYMMNFLNS